MDPDILRLLHPAKIVRAVKFETPADSRVIGRLCDGV